MYGDTEETDSVGQCGNQIGCRFWDLALREHASINTKGVYDEAMSSFFRNVDSRHDDPADIPLGSSTNKIRTLKARAVLVDMEEGVVSEIMKGPLRDIFDHRQLITDVSGSGNNWAVGHHEYGPKYRNQVSESIRRAAEHCDSLQCFFVLHSMGGGTGSGIGSYILRLLKDDYPDVYSFVTAVFPSDDDDVVTSPYNSVLAMRQLTEFADCVLPIENQALVDIISKILQALPPDKYGKRTFGRSLTPRLSRVKTESTLAASEGGVTKPRDEKPFDGMNNIVANLLLSLTSSSRFDGSLNVDLNEITMNLVPFPRMHYLVSSQTPLYSLADIKVPTRRLDQMFLDAFSPDNQLLKTDPKRGLFLACALLVRGKVEISDIRRNIERLKPSLNFIYWNKEGWKTGLCSVPPVGHAYSLLTLSNNSSIWHNFQNLKDRYVKLYRRKAHLCHYTRIENMEEEEFAESLESLNSIIEDYRGLEKISVEQKQAVPRLQIAT